MKTVKSYDGKLDVNIKSHQHSLRRWPLNIEAHLSDDGEAGLSGVVYETYQCGCKIKGNGSLQFPLSIKHCEAHRPKQKITKDEFKRLKSLLSDVVQWWDIWNSAKEPDEVGDPPIEDIREFLKKVN